MRFQALNRANSLCGATIGRQLDGDYVYVYTRQDYFTMISPQEAIARLRAGNQRFVSGETNQDQDKYLIRRGDLLDKQEPFAIIIGCSDSRVPAELIFDQGLGSLFVIRVAGNVVAPSQIGSVEFAAETFGTRLVIVLGHSQCGAIAATIEELECAQEGRSPNLRSIVSRIRPAVEPLMQTNLRSDPKALALHATRANIRAAANHLCHGSEILEEMIASGQLAVVCAEYSIETGKVSYLDDDPEGSV